MISAQSRRGFSLIELLVVIAIIGILSSVVLTSLGASRQKARVAAVQQTLHGIQTAGHSCLNDDTALSVPAEDNNGGGGPLCLGSAASYGVLPAGWIYCDDTPGTQSDTDCGDDTMLSTATTFTVYAESNADQTLVWCSDIECRTEANTD